MSTRRPTRGPPAQCPGLASSTMRSGRDLDDRKGPGALEGRLPLSRRRRPHDRESWMCQDGEQRRVRLHERDLHGPPVGHADLLDDARHAAKQRGSGGVHRRRIRVSGSNQPLQAVRHVPRSQRRAVMEPDTLAETKRPDEPISRHGPLDGERRFDIAATVGVAQERVEDLAGDQRHGSFQRGRRIEAWRAEREGRRGDCQVPPARAREHRGRAPRAGARARHATCLKLYAGITARATARANRMLESAARASGGPSPTNRVDAQPKLKERVTELQCWETRCSE